MKDKLLTALKTKYKNLGFGEKAFDGVADYLSKTVTEESQIETAISGVETLLKAFQGDVDKIRGEKTELQKKLDELEKSKDKDSKDKKPDPDEPAWFKAYREKQDADAAVLKQKIEGFEKKETQGSYLTKLKTALKEKKVPDVYWNNRAITIESDEQLEAITTEIETGYTGFKQEMVNSGVMIDVPVSSEGSNKAGEAMGKSIAEKRNTNSSDGIKGKELK